MTKEQIRNTIYRCALLYDKNLCNQQVLFVYHDANNHSSYAEVKFRAHNFLHFTGVLPVKLSANEFYRHALNHKLGIKDFTLGNNKNVELKLQVLPSIMLIDHIARMIGEYTGPHIELYTKKVTGTTSACLGLIQKDNYFIPNSVLKEDIRTIVPKPPGKIFAIFKKKIHDTRYTQLTYKSKNLYITQKCLPKELIAQIEPSLLENPKLESKSKHM
ncbi:MAG: hypothetical protein HDR27_01405 [Lachnospiraceae bacterium]|nr:hypothetical protein [Lachnospiraceae bacterium]